MKISDEIRKWCDGADVDGDAYGELRDLADRIDKETVELPRDRDGVPINVGDTVYLESGRKAIVDHINIRPAGENDIGISFIVCGIGFALGPEYLTHERPDNLKSIACELDDMVDDILGQDAVLTSSTYSRCAELRNLADRIRKLAAKEGQR